MTQDAALRVLDGHRRELTRQQLLTLRGQVLAGDVEGAMKGLARIVQMPEGTQERVAPYVAMLDIEPYSNTESRIPTMRTVGEK